MKIVREYKPNTVGWNELEQGQVFSDSEGEGLYLYLGMDNGIINVFNLEFNCLDELHTKNNSKVIIRKVKLVVEG